MFLAFKDIHDDPVPLDFRPPLADVRGPGGARLVRIPGTLTGWAVRGDRGIEVAGHVAARVTQECSRCLETFEIDVSSEFSLRVVAEAVEFGAGETRMSPDDAAVFYAEHDRVDLGAIAREQILLSLPLKPICRDGCRGLCPTCGANRNGIECACSGAEVDPRLAPLQALKQRLSGR